MKKTLSTITVCGKRVSYKTTFGFNTVDVTFYFPHRVCQELEFVIESDWSCCQYECVHNYRTYTAVRFTMNSKKFPMLHNVVLCCSKYIKKVSWMPIAGHHNFWKELDLWFGQQLYGLCGLDKEVQELLEKGYSLEEALHEWDLVTDFTEKTL